jgi:hypothetical protein
MSKRRAKPFQSWKRDVIDGVYYEEFDGALWVFPTGPESYNKYAAFVRAEGWKVKS